MSLSSLPTWTTGRRLLVAVLCGVILAGCAQRPGPELLTPTAAPANATIVKVLVATTRERLAPDVNVFTADRAAATNFAEFTIALPPGQGTVAMSDSRGTFSTVEQAALTKAQLKSRIAQWRRGPGRQDVYVFVHGFNNNFQESLFRIAQLKADAGVDAPVILFSWPSRARVAGYVADKDSVAFSRDHLASLLTDLAADPAVGRIGVLAHSMGGWLTMETLRQLRLAGKKQVLNRLNVVLAAPDIDVDLFRQQLSVIGPLSPPLTLLISREDEALAVSSRLGGANARVGNLDINDPRVEEGARRAKVRVIDITNMSSSDGMGHDRYVYVAALYPRIAASGRTNPAYQLGSAGAFILHGASATLEGLSGR